MNLENAIKDFNNKGYFKLVGVVDHNLIENICNDWDRVSNDYDSIKKEQGVFEESMFATHHCVINCPSLLDFLELDVLGPFLQWLFQGKYILNTMGISELHQNQKTYTQNIHSDVRSFVGASNLWVNSLVMLDDFTMETGPTWIYEGSHTFHTKPADDEFWGKAIPITGKRGDILVFHGNVWHAAGANKTNKRRRVLTPFYSRPFIKQQLDYAEFFQGISRVSESPMLQQILGLNARVPKSLAEFYKPKEKRFYKSDQG